MTTDVTVEKAKQVLEDAGYTVTGRQHHGLELLLITGACVPSHFYPVFGDGIRDNTIFDIKMLEDLVRYDTVKLYYTPPKNKPWYQKHDKYVGKRRT